MENKLNSWVRPITTISMVVVFCWLSLTGGIGSETFVGVATGVITWWFKARDEQKRS